MKIFIFSIILAVIEGLWFMSIAEAADHYIRASASGNNDGSDWTDAWTELPSSYTRGDTYYVAGGTYTRSGTLYLDTAVNGTDRITIKKATNADHGSEVGWSNDYGDGNQAVFTSSANGVIFNIRTGYWTIDGQVGGGPGSWKSGHGFKIAHGAHNNKLIKLGEYTPLVPSNCIFSHIAFDANRTLDDGPRCISSNCYYLGEEHPVSGSDALTYDDSNGCLLSGGMDGDFDENSWTVGLNVHVKRGTNATPGYYEILSREDANHIFIDANAGTGNGSDWAVSSPYHYEEGVANTQIDHCWFYGSYQLIHCGWGKDWIVEYCIFEDNINPGGAYGHGTAVQDYGSWGMTYRYNIFENIVGTATIDLKTGRRWEKRDWKIYGNVFLWTNEFNTWGYDVEDFPNQNRGTAYGPLGTPGNYDYGADVNGLRFYNNSIINVNTKSGSSRLARSGVCVADGNDILVKNNIWYDCNSVCRYYEEPNQTYDDNAFIACSWTNVQTGSITEPNVNEIDLPSGADPFIDWENLDFDLNLMNASGVACDDTGTSLGAPYNTDWDGTTGTNIGASQSESNAPTYFIGDAKWDTDYYWRLHLLLQRRYCRR